MDYEVEIINPKVADPRELLPGDIWYSTQSKKHYLVIRMASNVRGVCEGQSTPLRAGSYAQELETGEVTWMFSPGYEPGAHMEFKGTLAAHSVKIR